MFFLKLHRKSPIGKYISPVGLLAYIIFPVILYLLPSTYFDSGTSLCVSRLIFGFECYACGMTRAVMHWIHFEHEEALAYNKLSVFVFPLLVYVWAFSFFDELVFLMNSFNLITNKKKLKN